MSAYSLSDKQIDSTIRGIQPKGKPVELRYELVRKRLSTYLSPIMVESCIKQALARRGLSKPRDMGELQWMVEECMVGLRLFVPAKRLPELMVELSELLEDEY